MDLLQLKKGLDVFFSISKQLDKRNSNMVDWDAKHMSAIYAFVWLANQNKINNKKNTLHNLRDYLRCSTVTAYRTINLLKELKLIEITSYEYEEQIIPERKIFFGLFTIKQKVKKVITNLDRKVLITNDGFNLIKEIEKC